MNVTITERTPAPWIGFHLVGLWHEVGPEGFRRLNALHQQYPLQGEWLAVYYGNPQKDSPSQLAVETVICTPDEVPLPEGIPDVRAGMLAGGTYAVMQAVVDDGNFAKPWEQLINEWLPTSGWQPDKSRPCFENYLACQTEQGVWNIDLHMPVKK